MPTKTFRLENGNLYRCENKPDAELEVRSPVSGDADGQSLVCGGDGFEEHQDACYIYDVANDVFADGPTLPVPCERSASTVLENRRRWITGGYTDDNGQ